MLQPNNQKLSCDCRLSFWHASQAIPTHPGVLRAMTYTVCTVFGESAVLMQGTNQILIFRMGQGSAASPAVWLMLRIAVSWLVLSIVLVERHSDTSVDDDTLSIYQLVATESTDNDGSVMGKAVGLFKRSSLII